MILRRLLFARAQTPGQIGYTPTNLVMERADRNSLIVQCYACNNPGQEAISKMGFIIK